MILQPKPLVEFDVHNPEHVSAIMRVVRGEGLHPTLRFNERTPYTSAVTMALDMMAAEYERIVTGKAEKGSTDAMYDPQVVHLNDIRSAANAALRQN